jgi:hypothetical protein
MTAPKIIPTGHVLRINRDKAGNRHAMYYVDGKGRMIATSSAGEDAAQFTARSLRNLRSLDYVTGTGAHVETCKKAGVPYRKRQPGAGRPLGQVERFNWQAFVRRDVAAGFAQRAAIAGTTIGEQVEAAYEATEKAAVAGQIRRRQETNNTASKPRGKSAPHSP